MKKLLTILGGLSLTATASAPVMAMSPVSNNKVSNFKIDGNKWLNVGISDHVKPARLGNQTKEHHNTISDFSSNSSWDTFANPMVKTVQANGDFDLSTYWGSKDHSHILLELNDKESKINKRVWYYDETNHNGDEAVYQTSEITLKLTATYRDDKTIQFDLYYSIYAHSHNAVHSMHTNIRVDSLDWVQE